VKKATVAVKPKRIVRKVIKLEQKPWPIHVPAAAVIHEWRALSVIIGRKGCVDGLSSCRILKWITGTYAKP